MSTRKFSRVQFNVEATIGSRDRSFQGAVENLSMTGMFLVTDEQLPGDEPVDVTIVLAGILPEVAVRLKGVVTRRTEDGIGLAFEKMDPESFLHLKNIIAYNSDDAEKVMEEMTHSIDEKCALGTRRLDAGTRKAP